MLWSVTVQVRSSLQVAVISKARLAGVVKRKCCMAAVHIPIQSAFGYRKHSGK
jgi:hypothetical protein